MKLKRSPRCNSWERKMGVWVAVIHSRELYTLIYKGRGSSFEANATTLPSINFVHSTPVFSNSFNLPDASRSTPAHATLDNVKADSEIAVDAFKCLANDSSMVGDLELAAVSAQYPHRRYSSCTSVAPKFRVIFFSAPLTLEVLGSGVANMSSRILRFRSMTRGVASS